MFQTHNIQDTRTFFFETWEKHQQSQPLTPLESQLLEVILSHPAYHPVLAQRASSENRTYFAELGEVNPFLHMGLHLALREQISTNRPDGIRHAFETLLQRFQTQHEVEHLMMRCLEDTLWLAQKNGTMPDESAYLKACLAYI